MKWWAVKIAAMHTRRVSLNDSVTMKICIPRSNYYESQMQKILSAVSHSQFLIQLSLRRKMKGGHQEFQLAWCHGGRSRHSAWEMMFFISSFHNPVNGPNRSLHRKATLVNRKIAIWCRWCFTWTSPYIVHKKFTRNVQRNKPSKNLWLFFHLGFFVFADGCGEDVRQWLQAKHLERQQVVSGAA